MMYLLYSSQEELSNTFLSNNDTTGYTLVDWLNLVDRAAYLADVNVPPSAFPTAVYQLPATPIDDALWVGFRQPTNIADAESKRDTAITERSDWADIRSFIDTLLTNQDAAPYLPEVVNAVRLLESYGKYHPLIQPYWASLKVRLPSQLVDDVEALAVANNIPLVAE